MKNLWKSESRRQKRNAACIGGTTPQCNPNPAGQFGEFACGGRQTGDHSTRFVRNIRTKTQFHSSMCFFFRKNSLLAITAIVALLAVLAWWIGSRDIGAGAAVTPGDDRAVPASVADEIRHLPAADVTDANDGGGEGAPARAANARQPGEPGAAGPARYAAVLNEELAAQWEDFRRRHPGVDPTDDAGFHDAVLAERARFPPLLSQ